MLPFFLSLPLSCKFRRRGEQSSCDWKGVGSRGGGSCEKRQLVQEPVEMTFSGQYLGHGEALEALYLGKIALEAARRMDRQGRG